MVRFSTVRFSSCLKALLQPGVVLAQSVLRRPQTGHLRICRTQSERACKGRVFSKIFFEPTRREGGKERRGNAPLSASSILSCSSSPFFFERCNFAPGRTQDIPMRCTIQYDSLERTRGKRGGDALARLMTRFLSFFCSSLVNGCPEISDVDSSSDPPSSTKSGDDGA